jgi:hypothetical protein
MPACLHDLPRVAFPRHEEPGAWLQALHLVPAHPLRQSWLSRAEAEWQPGRVWFAAESNALLVFAELIDADLHHPPAPSGEPLFLSADTLELFLQWEGESAYREFHLTADGRTDRLVFPSAAAFAQRRRLGLPLPELLAPFRMPPGQECSRTWCDRKGGVWYARLRLSIPPADGAARELRLSAARYDHGPGRAPTLSCTSPLTARDFHRLEEFPRFRWPR